MQNRKLLHWLIFLALALTWGSSFILMKLGEKTFSSGQVASLRIFLAFLFMLPFAFRHFKKEYFSKIPAFAGMGIFGNLLPAFLFTRAETMISSALTGMLNSLTPVFTLLVGLFVFRQRVNFLKCAGVLIGLAGAVGLMAIEKKADPSAGIFSFDGMIITGGLLVVLATFFYGVSVNIIKAKLDGVPAVTATFFALLIVGPLAGIYLFSTDFLRRMQEPGAWESFGYVSILGVCGTSLSVIVYNILIRETGTLFAASVTYLMPVVAMLWGIGSGETLSLMDCFFVLIILGGVWMVNKK